MSEVSVGMKRQRWMRLGVAAVALALLVGCGGARPEPDGAPSPSSSGSATAPTSGSEGPRSPGPLAQAVKPVAGGLAPSLRAVDVATGETITLADLKGQVVFLNFWATWCSPCKAEMPEMERFHKEMGDKVRILAVGAERKESPKQLAAFAQALELTFPIAHDEGVAAAAYRVSGIPTSFFIDKDGVIQVRHTGLLNFDQMKELAAQAGAKP